MDDLATGWEHQRAGRLADAEACYRRFLASHPNHAKGWAAVGVVAFKQQNVDEAITCYLRSLALDPGSADVLTNLGVAYAVKRDFDAAEQSLRQAMAVQPDFTEAYRNLGHALRDQGKFADAVEVYRQARKLRSDDIDILGSLGSVLEQSNRAAEAIEPLVEAIRLAPRDVHRHHLLGIALAAAKRFDDARAVHDRALQLDRASDNGYLDSRSVKAEAERRDEADQNHDTALRNLNEEARALAAAAIKHRRESAVAHKDLGIALGRIGRNEESGRAFERALALDPDYPDARYFRAVTKLALGDYVEGFAEYEWRWRCSTFVRPNYSQPIWNGESIAGKTILLIDEQGLGDSIQFIRFAPKVKALGATVLFRCPPPLVTLFANVKGIDVLIPEGETLPLFDMYIPLISLPAIFRTSLEDVPGICPVPYLQADPNLVDRWRDRLGPRAPGEFRVGIYWQGNPAHPGDRFRSVPLEAFLLLATVPGVKLISIKKYHGVDQIAPLADRLPLLDFRDSTAFEDSAAVMSLLDLMVTIDSAPAHLAGALGVPTWLALSTDVEWRWLAGRDDSPWYPSVRIFRQRELHNWADVFQHITRALAERATCPRNDTSATPNSFEATIIPNQETEHGIAVVDDLGTGWKHQEAGRLANAEACYRRFLASHPNHAKVWAAVGVVAFKQQNVDEAITCYLRSLSLRPRSADVFTNLGAAYAIKRDFDAAEHSLRQAIAVEPLFIEAYRNLGHALRDQGKFADAVEVYRQAKMLRPSDIDILGSLGHALHNANRELEAIEPLIEAVRLAPRAVDLHRLLGVSLTKAKRFEEAEAAFRRTLSSDHTDADTYRNLGFVQASVSRFAEAEASYREAIRLNPELVEAYQNLGDILRDQDRHDEALACYSTAIKLRPDVPEVHCNVGFALGRIGRCEDSIRAYDRALALAPEHLYARKNRAIMKLTLGNYLEGYAEFNSSWRSLHVVPRDFTEPVWEGGQLDGKTILLIAEEGLGDTIQFIRFAFKVKALGAKVLFWCYKPLLKLFHKLHGIDVLVAADERLPPFDVYAPLMSLPAIFRTRLEEIPDVHRVPYLEADSQLVEHWRDRLGFRAPNELRVGICWQGNPVASYDRYRSVPLASFLPLVAVPGVKWISLQKGHGVEQIASLADRLPLVDLSDSTGFEDTAAIMTLLDVVITIDSAPAHLAGALGVPTWLPLSTNVEWRWLAHREDSPWYPTVRIFRQTKLHNWDDVFQRMGQRLAELAASPTHARLERPISV